MPAPRPLLPIIAAAAAIVLLGAGGWWWLGRATSPGLLPGGPSPAERVVAANQSVATAAKAEAFCGGCHRMPDPAYFTRDRWHEEVERGYRFHAESSRVDLSAPPLRDVVAYFRDRAPEALALAEPADEPSRSVAFRETPVAPAAAPTQDGVERPLPAVSFVGRVELTPGGGPALVACDMNSGDLLAIDPASGAPQARVLARVGHPAHAAACDLDADGATDLVVADLGSFLPQDHDLGRVVWLRNRGAAGYEPVVLLDRVGRVADVRPGDFDGDGDQDLVVAEFGWQKTGSIRLLLNEGAEAGAAAPRFASRMIDERHGTIHVPVVDWDGDAKPDFFALISQEHEAVELFRNRGDGTFRREPVAGPEDPAFGSSGIEPVDLDGDGDRDLLATNGDTFDSYEIKPYHGVRWIENAEGRWVSRPLTAMPGVHRALAGDLDGDGDLDVAAAALLPDRLFGDAASAAAFDSLIWLEQVEPGRFVRHPIERGTCRHAALEVADFDGDGRCDIATGQFQNPAGASPASIWKSVPAGVAAGPGVAAGAAR